MAREITFMRGSRDSSWEAHEVLPCMLIKPGVGQHHRRYTELHRKETWRGHFSWVQFMMQKMRCSSRRRHFLNLHIPPPYFQKGLGRMTSHGLRAPFSKPAGPGWWGMTFRSKLFHTPESLWGSNYSSDWALTENYPQGETGCWSFPL